MFIYELPNWPNFSYQTDTITLKLAEIRHEQGKLLGKMEAIGFSLRQEATLETLTLDILKTSEIEGENLGREEVRSSVARKLGIDFKNLLKPGRDVEGIVEMMLDATQHYDKPLTKQRLLDWHASLFPTGRSGMYRIRVGEWRDDKTGPMEVVSGAIGKEKIHYIAPDAEQIEAQMTVFLHWFNTTEQDWVLKAAIAHFWFITIHPFEDGNGRIARAIADMSLARSEKTAQRFYSLSHQIRKERKVYYTILENSQKGSLDITSWLLWFLGALEQSIYDSEITLKNILRKAEFWDKAKMLSLNERQHKVLNLLLDGFEGKMTSSKWASIAKCSQDTAHRDIQDLIIKNLLLKAPDGGRSTHYLLFST